MQAPGNDLPVYFDGHLALCVAFGIEQRADAEVCSHLARCTIEKDLDHRLSLTRHRSPGSDCCRQKKPRPGCPGRAVSHVAVLQWPPPPLLSLSLSLSLLLSFFPCCGCGCGGGGGRWTCGGGGGGAR